MKPLHHNPSFPPQQPFDLREAHELNCHCGATVFEKLFKLGEISDLAPSNKTGKTVRVVIEVFRCLYCNRIIDEPEREEVN